MTQQQSKNKYIQRANINDSPRAPSSRDQGDCTSESHRSFTYKFKPQTQGVRIDQFKKQRQTRRVSQIIGRQRNNLQSKGKEESPETV